MRVSSSTNSFVIPEAVAMAFLPLQKQVVDQVSKGFAGESSRVISSCM